MGCPNGHLHKNYERDRPSRETQLVVQESLSFMPISMCLMYYYIWLTVAEINIHISGNRMSAALSVILELMFHYYQVAGLINHQPL